MPYFYKAYLILALVHQLRIYHQLRVYLQPKLYLKPRVHTQPNAYIQPRVYPPSQSIPSVRVQLQPSVYPQPIVYSPAQLQPQLTVYSNQSISPAQCILPKSEYSLPDQSISPAQSDHQHKVYPQLSVCSQSIAPTSYSRGYFKLNCFISQVTHKYKMGQSRLYLHRLEYAPLLFPCNKMVIFVSTDDSLGYYESYKVTRPYRFLVCILQPSIFILIP